MHSDEPSKLERGKRLKSLRETRGWSQQAAANLVGVRREMWAKYEVGAEPGAKVLAALAAEGVDVDYILTGTPARPGPEKLTHTLDKLKAMTLRSLDLTNDPQKGELIRDVLLGDAWNKPEIIDAAIERYVAVRSEQVKQQPPVEKKLRKRS